MKKEKSHAEKMRLKNQQRRASLFEPDQDYNQNFAVSQADMFTHSSAGPVFDFSLSDHGRTFEVISNTSHSKHPLGLNCPSSAEIKAARKIVRFLTLCRNVRLTFERRFQQVFISSVVRIQDAIRRRLLRKRAK